jgi:ribonuclease HI
VPHRVQWIWVKGHAGNAGNERADALANRGVDSILSV